MMQFINPYNFVSLSKTRGKAYADTDQHTGVITYKITTKSPLFIPNSSSDCAFPDYTAADESKEHKSQDFYSYNNLITGQDYKNVLFSPVIPGSELRGMFRNLYETITDSCMSVLNEDMNPFKRTMEAFSAGLIERKPNGTYAFWEAEDCIFHIFKAKIGARNTYYRIFDDYTRVPYGEGEKLYFVKNKRTAPNGRPIKPDTKSVSKTKKPGDAEGYLIRGEADGSIGKKTNCHLFIKNKLTTRSITDKEITALEEVIHAYQDEPGASNAYSNYERALRNFKKGQGENFFPVYYSAVAGYFYLAPASFTKERAEHSVGDLAGDMVPCQKKDDMCPACSLFGMTGKNNEEAVASKIRVADASLANGFSKENCYDPIITLEILGAPKISNSEFYLKNPGGGANFWTYDYLVRNGKILNYQAELRGRKFYWHQPETVLPNGVERSDQNRTVRPVKSGVEFIGKVYFDRISKKQLDQIIWLLNCGTPSDQVNKGEIAYKLGGGKPLGLGSVICKVLSVSERKIRWENNQIVYDNITREADEISVVTYTQAGFSESVKNEFLTINSLNAVTGIDGKNVSYPVTDEQLRAGGNVTESFRWFAANHGEAMVSRRRDMKIIETLPNIEDESKASAVIQKVTPELEVGTVFSADVLNVVGKTLKVKTSNGITVNLKAGEDNGLENISRKELQNSFTAGKKVNLQYLGENSEGRKLWKFVGLID